MTDVTAVHPLQEMKDAAVSFASAMRLKYLPASLSPAAVILAYLHFNSGAVIVVICLHIGGNASNTYFDYLKGYDKKASATDRTIVDGVLTSDEVRGLSHFFYLLALGTIVYISPVRQVECYMVALVGVLLGYFYTGDPLNFKYRGLGDMIIALCFGPGVFYSVSLFVNVIDYRILPLLVPLTCLTVASMITNHTRDMDVQGQNAKTKTLAFRLGLSGSLFYLSLLVSISFLVIAGLCYQRHYAFALPLLASPLGVTLPVDFADKKFGRAASNLAFLHAAVTVALIASIYLSS